MHALRTIDVWDTLLRRKCHPEFAKVATALCLYMRHDVRFRISECDHRELYKQRVATEARLAEQARSLGGDNEYEIVHVLRCWLDSVAESDFDPLLPGYLADFELDFERRHTYVDPTIHTCLQQYPAAKTLFLSDFYMSADRLMTLLRHHGIDDFVPDGISSCDIGLNKRSGKLFSYVHERYGVHAADHIHIGDNLSADVEIPRKLGIKAVHFQPADEHAKRLKIEQCFHNRNVLFQHITNEAQGQIAKEIHHQWASGPGFRAGIRCAPLFVGFCLFVAERAVAKRVRNALFFTTEGEFLIKVWQTLFAHGRYVGYSLPVVAVLKTNARSNLYTTLAKDEFAEIFKVHGITFPQDISRMVQDTRVRNLSKDPRFCSYIRDYADGELRGLLDLLHKYCPAVDNSSVGIVDVGCSGIVHEELGILLPNSRLTGHYLGVAKRRNDQGGCNEQRYCAPNVNISDSYLGPIETVSFLEMLFKMSPPLKFKHEDAEMRALVPREIRESPVDWDFVSGFQAGVLSAARNWGQYLDNHVITSLDLIDLSRTIWSDLTEVCAEESKLCKVRRAGDCP